MSQKVYSELNNSNMLDGEAEEQELENNSSPEDAEGEDSETYNEEEELISKNSQDEDDNATVKQEQKAESSSSESNSNTPRAKKSKIKTLQEKEIGEKNLIEIEQHDSEAEVEKEYELLFCVQGIGKETSGKAYEKHQFCEPSLRDIHRFLRNDDQENPQMKYMILNWKTAETDIIPLMLNYENSEKIQQLGLVLLTDLTEPLSELVEKRPQFEMLLTDLQEFIVKSQLVELLSNTLADATAKLREATIMRNDLKLLENELSLVNRKKKNNDGINSNDNNNLDNEGRDLIGKSGEFEGGNNKSDPYNNFKIEDILNEEEKRKKSEIKKKIAEIESKAEQLIELVFVFFKQLLSIYFSNSIEKNLENILCFIRKFSKCKIFDAIIYHSQSYNSDFSRRLAPVLLELIHLLLRPFEPMKIFEFCRSNKFNYESFKSGNSATSLGFQDKRKSDLSFIRENEHKEKMLRFNQQSHRPNNFGTTLKVTRPLDNSTIVISNFNQFIQNPEKIINEKMNTLANQRKKPVRKLVKKVKMNALKISEEIKFINDYKICENMCLDFSHADIVFPIKSFCEEFLKYCFNNVVKYFIAEIISLSDAFEKYDFYNLINLISFFLNFERLRLHDYIGSEKSKDALSASGKVDKKRYNALYDLTNVLEGISPAVMDFIYNIFFNESIKGPKDNRKIYEFYAGSRYIQHLLLICLDLHKFKTEQNLDFSVLIQDYILSRDFRKPLKAMFILYNENHYPQAILFNCIQLTDIYFTCLEYISQKRKLKIKTKKRLKTRKESEDEEKLVAKLKNEEKNSNFIIKQENSDSEDSQQAKSIESDEEKYEILERDLDIKSEIEQLLDYSIISKIIRLFNFNLNSNKNFSGENPKEIENLKKENISKYIFNIFNRIVTKINASWIFYQVEYLSILHDIMNNKLFSNDAYFANLKGLFSQITKNFFELFNTKNKLVMVESLFRFSGPMHKNQILSNYELTDIAEEYEANATSTSNNLNSNNDELNAQNNKNYSDEEADAVYDGKILFERDLEDNQIKKPKAKKKEEAYLENLELIKWTENEDLVLIDNYFEFKDHEDYLDILDKLFPLKTSKDIKHRIKTLKLKKGYEKAMKVIKKIHQKKKEKEENLFNVIIELSDECRNETKKQKIEKTISAIKEQLRSYKLKKDLLINSPEIDCVLIPTSNDEIDVFKDKKFMEFIRNIGFMPPADIDNDVSVSQKNNIGENNNKNKQVIDLTKNDDLQINENDKMDIVENSSYVKDNFINIDGENKPADLMDIVDESENNIKENKQDLVDREENLNKGSNKFWKINPLSDATDIEIMIEKLHNFEKVINENMQVNQEYEEIKRKNKKDKKEKKKKHKKDKKKKHKKDKKNKKDKSHRNTEKDDCESGNENYADGDEIKSSRSESENNEDADEENYDGDLFASKFAGGDKQNSLSGKSDEINAENDEKEQSDEDRKKDKKSKKNKFSKENFYAAEADKNKYDDLGDETRDLMDLEDNAESAKKDDLDELEFLNNNLSKNKKRLKKGMKDNNYLTEFE